MSSIQNGFKAVLYCVLRSVRMNWKEPWNFLFLFFNDKLPHHRNQKFLFVCSNFSHLLGGLRQYSSNYAPRHTSASLKPSGGVQYTTLTLHKWFSNGLVSRRWRICSSHILSFMPVINDIETLKSMPQHVLE
jgi:hypothetical protein